MPIAYQAKKLALVLMTSLFMIVASMAADPKVSIPTAKALTFVIENSALPLKRVLYIYYLVQLKKDQAKILALLNSDSKINTTTLTFMAKLDL